jgi:hypothetical protein
MKIALCFIINYDHILNKEHLWKEWIEPNKDIINVYFYYKEIKKIKSKWIMEHTLPPSYIYETSYFHIIPAYFSLMNFALKHDNNNQWFCMLTDSCCPIISPKKFRYLFYNYYQKSIINWSPAWWNIDFDKRSNLALLPEELRLANDPWFIMKRENVIQCLNFAHNHSKISSTICNGGLANESLFAIILYSYKQLNSPNLISAVSHITDWVRRSSATSPHLFKDGDELDIQFIDKSLASEKFAVFIRKIAPEFSDEILRYYLFEHSKKEDNQLILREPLIFIFNRLKKYFYYGMGLILIIFLFNLFNNKLY